MSMIVLQTDKWDGVYNRSDTYKNPTWEEIETAIKALDQKKRTQIVIQREDSSNISVGGGNGRYYVCITTSDERFLILKQEKKGKGKKQLVVGGQVGNYPTETIVTITLVLKAVETFHKTGKIEKTLNWIEE